MPINAEIGEWAVPALEQSVGKTLTQVIGWLGAPDRVILPTDDHELAEELGPGDVHVYWLVPNCHPVNLTARQGIVTGLDYSAFGAPHIMCGVGMEKYTDPGPDYSCNLPERRIYCR